jgi:pimeloyl-ACP methyl ester carboxylesterase
MSLPTIAHRFADVNGLRIFYREAGPKDAPTVLLLHGFPSASHQYRRLMDALGGSYHLIAPDYPGFGHSDAPLPASRGGPFRYSFDALADVMEGFVQALGLTRFVAYLFDFGAPVGLRLAQRHPDWIAGLIVQNGNAYEQGLSEIAKGLTAMKPGLPGAEAAIRGILTLDVTRSQYQGGAKNPEAIAPEGWLLDQHFLDLPGRAEIQVDLGLDYHSNVALYPQWQAWLRRHQPPALVLWGRNDPFFVPAGAEAFKADLPQAEVHLLETGHFALEECLPEAVALIEPFLQRLPAWA